MKRYHKHPHKPKRIFNAQNAKEKQWARAVLNYLDALRKNYYRELDMNSLRSYLCSGVKPRVMVLLLVRYGVWDTSSTRNAARDIAQGRRGHTSHDGVLLRDLKIPSSLLDSRGRFVYNEHTRNFILSQL